MNKKVVLASLKILEENCHANSLQLFNAIMQFFTVDDAKELTEELVKQWKEDKRVTNPRFREELNEKVIRHAQGEAIRRRRFSTRLNKDNQ